MSCCVHGRVLRSKKTVLCRADLRSIGLFGARTNPAGGYGVPAGFCERCGLWPVQESPAVSGVNPARQGSPR